MEVILSLCIYLNNTPRVRPSAVDGEEGGGVQGRGRRKQRVRRAAVHRLGNLPRGAALGAPPCDSDLWELFLGLEKYYLV